MKKQMVLLSIVMGVLIIGSSAIAQIGLNSVFGGLGYVMPEGDHLGNTIGFGGGVNLGEITNKVGLEADLTYWKKGWDESGYGYEVEGDFSQLSIAGTARYMVNPDADIQFEVGGGLGYTRSAYSSDITYDMPYYMVKASSPMATMASSDSDSKSGLVIHLSGLARKQFSPQMQGVAEVRYSLGGDDHGDNLGIWVKVNYLLKP